MSAPAGPRAAATRGARVAAIALLALSVPLFLVPPAADDDGSSILGVRLPDAPGLDKAVHAIVFALLGATGALGWPGARRARWLLALLLAYGALVELVQGAIPGRAASFADWVADAAGAVAGVWGGASMSRAPRYNHHN